MHAKISMIGKGAAAGLATLGIHTYTEGKKPNGGEIRR